MLTSKQLDALDGRQKLPTEKCGSFAPKKKNKTKKLQLAAPISDKSRAVRARHRLDFFVRTLMRQRFAARRRDRRLASSRS